MRCDASLLLVVKKPYDLDFFLRLIFLANVELDCLPERFQARVPLAFAFFANDVDAIFILDPTRFHAVVLVGIKSQKDNGSLHVLKNLHHSPIFANWIVKVVLVLVDLDDDDLVAQIQEEIGAARRAAAGDALVLGPRDFGKVVDNKVYGSAFFCFVVAKHRFVWKHVYKTAQAMAIVSVLSRQIGYIALYTSFTSDIFHKIELVLYAVCGHFIGCSVCRPTITRGM